MTIAYGRGSKLYLNITNRCTNNCVFCIRRTKEGVGYDLWMPKEPSLQEALDAIDNPEQYEEIVFCGYGEPLIRIEMVAALAGELKKKGTRQIRINTNGHANLIHNRNVVPELAEYVDVMSISLNAQNAKTYGKISRPIKFSADEAYTAVLEFARESKKHIKKVVLSVVNWPGVDLKACKEVADEIGADFRIRKFIGTIIDEGYKAKRLRC